MSESIYKVSAAPGSSLTRLMVSLLRSEINLFNKCGHIAPFVLTHNDEDSKQLALPVYITRRSDVQRPPSPLPPFSPPPPLSPPTPPPATVEDDSSFPFLL
jgi:hypothetical protein